MKPVVISMNAGIEQKRQRVDFNESWILDNEN